MTMTQPYYGNEFDSFGRSIHRAPSGAQYDRPTAYPHGYYNMPCHESHAESRGSSGDAGVDKGSHRISRRRIQVACSRCRRRKIKCSGDTGGGSGCAACKTAATDKEICTFIRVGSHPIPVANVDMISPSNGTSSRLPSSTATTTTTYGTNAWPSTYDTGFHVGQHQANLPMLQTRGAYPQCDSHAPSLADDYAYTSFAPTRAQSYVAGTGLESFRRWTNASVPGPNVPGHMCCEPGVPFNFSHLQPGNLYPTPSTSRLPSIAVEPSPLNMASLNSSLPTQTVQERRLPMPCTPGHSPFAYPSLDASRAKQISPSVSPDKTPRAHINGIHSLSGMTWSTDRAEAQLPLAIGAQSSLSSLQRHHLTQFQESSRPPARVEPILGYQFNAAAAGSETSLPVGDVPSASFSGAPSSSDSVATTSTMLPLEHDREFSPNRSTPSAANVDGGPVKTPSASSDATASLYSYSSGNDGSDRTSPPYPASHDISNDNQYRTSPQCESPHQHHRQQHHVVSCEEMQDRSPQGRQRVATVHRPSVSKITRGY